MRRFIFVTLCLAAWASAGAAEDPIVAVSGGRIQGRIASSGGGATFRGIPFAQPPTGDLRWREPQPVKPWSKLRDGSNLNVACPQVAQGWNDASAAVGKEDCLYLNVLAPEWPALKRRPVMVWFHGGGNTGGSGIERGFNGGQLTQLGVVLVTFNYRLGALGFLAHPELTAESPHDGSGNYGLLDQIAALKWVKKNIAKFGGDPNNVAIFGQSAGAQDIGLLMTSPLAKALFQRAIAESGTVSIGGRMTATLAEAQALGEKFGQALNAPAQGTFQYLRSLPVETILKAQESAWAGGPNVDGWVLKRQPTAVFAAGNEAHVPLIIGNNGRERVFSGGPDALQKAIEGYYGGLTPEALKLYDVADQPQGEMYPPYGSAGDQFRTDTGFRCDAVTIAGYHGAAGNAVYEYEFTPGTPERGAAHSAELQYLFGLTSGDLSSGLRQLAESIPAYWTNFAKTGDPNGSPLPTWPKYDGRQRSYIEFSSDGPVAKAYLRRPFCELYLKLIQQKLASMQPPD